MIMSTGCLGGWHMQGGDDLIACLYLIPIRCVVGRLEINESTLALHAAELQLHYSCVRNAGDDPGFFVPFVGSTVKDETQIVHSCSTWQS
jgi:hypothetical protein